MTTIVKFTGPQVEAALARWGLTSMRTLDHYYWCVGQDYWDAVLGYLPPSALWEAEEHDCDDIALEFKVDVRRIFKLRSAGVVFNATHAFIVLVLADSTLRLVDPGWSVGAVYVEPGSPGTLYDLAGATVLI